jgi:hypothetical protein
MELPSVYCNRLHGKSVFDCLCKLPDEGGWLECPSEARRPVIRAAPNFISAMPPSISGEFCLTCGSPSMIRTGTCLTCGDCGSSDGGCS